MKRPAIFFDRDNTLIACDDYLGDPGKVVLVSGAADAVARARAMGFATVVFSNQSGVARGYFDEKTVHSVNQRMDELLAEQNSRAIIDRHEFCPDHPEGSVVAYRKESTRRKPAPGMIYSAADALALDLSRSWVIGDAPRDIEAGKAAGLRTILFCDPALSKSPAADAEAKAQPDYCVTTLKEAIDYIERSVAGLPVDENVPAESERESEPEPPSVTTDLPTPAVESRAVEPQASTAPPASSSDGVIPSAAPDTLKSVAAPAPAPVTERAAEPIVTQVTPPVSTAKMEQMLAEMLRELRKQSTDLHDDDFSVSKLLAGIVQVVVLAVLFLAYLYRHETQLLAVLVFALTLQTMTIALLIMGKQR